MPWAMLAEEIDKGKHRTMALTVVAAVAVGILAFLVVRTIRQPPGTVVEVPSTAVVAPGSPATSGVTASTVAPTAAVPDPASAAVPGGSVVYSEEDLRAGVPDVDMRLAEVRAEWFVSEYFSTGSSVTARCPRGRPSTAPCRRAHTHGWSGPAASRSKPREGAIRRDRGVPHRGR